MVRRRSLRIRASSYVRLTHRCRNWTHGRLNVTSVPALSGSVVGSGRALLRGPRVLSPLGLSVLPACQLPRHEEGHGLGAPRRQQLTSENGGVSPHSVDASWPYPNEVRSREGPARFKRICRWATVGSGAIVGMESPLQRSPVQSAKVAIVRDAYDRFGFFRYRPLAARTLQ